MKKKSTNKKTTNKKKIIKKSNIAKNKNIINIKINTHQNKTRQKQTPQNETKKEPSKAGEVVFLPARTIYQQTPLQPVQNYNFGELENIRESVKRQEDLFAKYLNTINLAGRSEILSPEIPVKVPVKAPVKAPVKTPKVPAPKPTVTESLDDLPVDSASSDGIQTLNEVDTNQDKDLLLTTPSKPTLADHFKKAETPMNKVITELKQKLNERNENESDENALNKIMNNSVEQVKYDQKFKEYVELKKRIKGTSTNKTTKNKLNSIDKLQDAIDKLLAKETKTEKFSRNTRNLVEDEDTRPLFN